MSTLQCRIALVWGFFPPLNHLEGNKNTEQFASTRVPDTQGQLEFFDARRDVPAQDGICGAL